MQDTLYAILTNLTVLGGVLLIVKYVFEKAKTENKVYQFAIAAALETYEEYVRHVKRFNEDGSLSDAERKQAQGLAVQKLIEIGKEQGMDLAKEYGPRLLKSLIERAVNRLKA